MRSPRNLICFTSLFLFLYSIVFSVDAQVAYINTYRQKILSQISTNPIPILYRYAVTAAGANLKSGSSQGPTTIDTLSGSSLQMSYSTNFPAYSIGETNLTGGLAEFNNVYPPGAYNLRMESKVSVVPIVQNFIATFTNDFDLTEPVFTNVSPLMALSSVQTFKWAPYGSKGGCYARFLLFEGKLNTNMVNEIMTSGVEAITNSLAIVAWENKMDPSRTEITVSNIDTSMDHIAMLEFHCLNSMTGGVGGVNEAANISANATMFFALRIVSAPENQSVVEGDTAVFTAIAIGATPINYQWKFKGLDIPNATNRILAIVNSVKSNEGDYRVLVSNPSGSLLSDPGYLTLTNAPPQSDYIELSLPSFSRTNGFKFLVSGNTGSTYDVERSSDLLQWTPIGSVTTPDGTNYFTDTTATNMAVANGYYKVKKTR
jgi:hypothetical protein